MLLADMARFVPLSPELALLAACNLASDRVLADRAREAARGGIDWDRFGHLADHHGMGGLAGARLARTAPGLVPDALAGALRRVLRQQAVLQLAQTAESASLTARLGGAGIRTIVLKGMALAHTLYTPDPEWRSSLDIDILIDQADLLEADRVLRDAGYSRGWPTGDLPVAGLGMFLNLANVFEYVSPINGITVELHFRPTLNPHCLPVDFAALYAASSPIETACGTFRGLDGPLHIAYLCWHAIGHAGYRLKWFGDIARALQGLGAALGLAG